MPPNSGLPEDNSKTDPTAAIAVIQHNSKHTPLLGVIEIMVFTPLIN
jgi:hypothetical protein